MDRKEVDSFFSWMKEEDIYSKEFMNQLFWEVEISGIESIPNEWSFILFSNHPSTVDPILWLNVLEVRPDTKIIMRKQNDKNFPIIAKFQNKIKWEYFIYTDEVRKIIEHINWWFFNKKFNF